MSHRQRQDQLARAAQIEARERAKKIADVVAQRRQVLDLAFEHEGLCKAFLERAQALREGATAGADIERYDAFVAEGKARVRGAQHFVCLVIDDVIFTHTPVNPGEEPAIVEPTDAEVATVTAAGALAPEFLGTEGA